MSNIERRNRINQLKERLFFEIKDSAGGGGGGYGAPDIPSYNAPAVQQQAPPSYSQPARPSYNQQAPPKPSYNAKPSYGGGGGKGGKILEIPLPDLPIPDPIQFKAGVLRSKGRIASGLLHTKAGILRAGANILAQKANALDKFAQAIPAIKANLINTMTGFGGGGGGGYGAPPPSNTYGAPPPQPSYNNNRPQPQQQAPPLGPTQSSYNGGTSAPQSFNTGNSFGSTSAPQSFNNGNGNNFVNSVQSSSNSQGSYNSGSSNSQSNSFNPPSNNQNFRPSNQDGYGSPTGDVITGAGITTIVEPRDVGNIQVGSSLTFGNNNQANNNQFTNQGNSIDSFRSNNGFNPLVQSTLDQTSNGKRNVFGTAGIGSNQIRPGQQTSITLNDLNNLRNQQEKLVLQETRAAQQVRGNTVQRSSTGTAVILVVRLVSQNLAHSNERGDRVGKFNCRRMIPESGQ